MKSFMMCMVLVACVTASFCEEQVEETIVTTRTGVLSKYLDRSVLRNADPVVVSDVRVDHKNFGLELKGIMDTTNYNDNSWEFTKIELQFDYTFHFNKLATQVGLVYFTYPSSNGRSEKSTEEAFIKSSYDVGYNLTPYVKMSYDLDEANGLYTEVGAEHVLDISDKVKFGPITSTKVKSHASIGYASNNYNDYYFGHDDNNFDIAKIGTGVEFGIGKMWTVTPDVEYYYMLDKTIDNNYDKYGSGFICGLNLGCKF